MPAARLLLCLLLLALSPVRADEARARDLLRAGRPAEALQETSGDSPSTQLLRAEAHLDLAHYTEADLALQRLQPLAPEGLLLQRGRLERARGETELARRLLQDAQRAARTPAQRLQAIDETLLLHLTLEDNDALSKTLEASETLTPQVEDRVALARHLETTARVQQWRGQRSEAAISLAAARSLWQAETMPARAARTMLLQADLIGKSGDTETAWTKGHQALTASLEAGDLEHVMRALRFTNEVAMRLPARQPDQRALLAATATALPPGPWRYRARQEWARHLMDANTDLATMQRLLQENLAQPDLDRRNKVEALHLLAAARGHAGRFEEARDLLSQALTLAEPTFELDWYRDTSPGPILLTRGHQERQQNRPAQSLATLQQALQAQPQADWRPWRTQAHYASLLAASAIYDVEAARRQFHDGLENLRGLPTREARALSLHRLLAALLINQSQNDDLIDPGQRALGSYDTLARTLLDDMLAPAGALDEYLTIYDSWIDQLRASRDESREPLALIYKAIFLEAAGHLPEARAACLQGIEQADRRKLDFPATLGRLILARVELGAGRTDAATQALGEARRTAQALPFTAQLYELLHASHQLSRANYAEALAGYDRTLAKEESKSWRGHYGRAQSLAGMGRPAEALLALEQAETVMEGARPFSRAALSSLKGEVLLSLNRPEEALSVLASAYQTLLQAGASPSLEEVTLRYADALGALDRKPEALRVSRQALDLLTPFQDPASLRKLFERVATLALETGETELAVRYLELSRSAELVGSVSLSRVEHKDPQTRALLADLDSLKSRLEQLQSEAGGTEEGDRRAGFTRLMAATRAEFFSKLDQLKTREPDFESLVQLSGSDLSAISAQLGPEEALIEYFPSQDILYLIVVTADRFRLHEVRIGRQALDKAVQDYLNLLRDPESSLEPLKVASHTLYGLLVEPAMADLAGLRRWRVVPSGTLWQVPFEELRDGQGVPLNDSVEVSLLTSADLLRTLSDSSQKKGETLLLGAPDGEDLQGAREELRRLHELLVPSRILAGPQATASALREKLGEVQTLHVASHSGLGELPGQGYITLADGPLTAEQIYGLSMRPGSLVVLSSCRSGVGETVPGRELTSLASAFNIAGASTVVASHWEVDDEVTTELMLEFYRQIQGGQGRAEALRRARAALARSHPHPYYWAAFSLFGSPL